MFAKAIFVLGAAALALAGCNQQDNTTAQQAGDVAQDVGAAAAGVGAGGMGAVSTDAYVRDAAIADALTEHDRAGVPLYLLYPAGGGEPKVLPQLLTSGMVAQALREAANG